MLYVTDVVIAPASGGAQQTIYAAVQDLAPYPTEQHVYQSTDAGETWQQVPGFTAVSRIALAVAPTDPTAVYALARGQEPDKKAGAAAGVPTSLARLVGGTFQPVTDAPPSLSGGAGKDHSGYATLVAVDPVDRNVVWLGGTAVISPAMNQENAALFRAGLKNPAPGTWSFAFNAANAGQPGSDPSWVGGGAHSDVHALAFSGPAAASTVWLGCDGGVFQCQLVSPAPPNAHGTAAGTAPGPWRPLNNGLAITQQNFLAQTTVSDFLLLAGTQDNGIEERTGTEVWTMAKEGDGGGCAIDDASPARRFAQYINFTWYTVGTPGGLYAETLDYSGAPQPLADAWTAENSQSAFASQAAVRQLASGKTALAFGSHRVWYCEDWGQGWNTTAGGPDSWRTLPTGKNPYEGRKLLFLRAADNSLDSLNSQVVRVAFADDDHLLALTQAWPTTVTAQPSPRRAALYLFTRSAAGWAQSALSEPAPGAPAAPPNAGPQPRFPDGEVPKGLAIDQPGPPPACYVALGADQQLEGMDHVWWYDGASWWPCHPDPKGPDKDAVLPDAPANAAAVDADRTVYVGTDVGVWKGVHTAAGAAHWWKWTPCSNGLPESPVTDLLILPRPHLLRAATFGRGTWELNLDETQSMTETYLRAHVADTRRVFPAAAVPADKLFGPPDSRLDASPDIVVSPPASAAASSPPPSSGLPLARARRPRRSELVRVLQYALRRRQEAGQPAALAALPQLVTDGYFGKRTQEAVRAFQQAQGAATPSAVVAAADWQAIVAAPYIDALAGADPTYLDMALLDRISPVPVLASGDPSLFMKPSAEVYVQVNARGRQRRPAGTVRLGLFATPAFDATLATLPALPGDWVKQFTDAFTTKPSAPWLTGSNDWAWIGSPATLAITRALHPEEPQVVRFTATLPVPPGAATVPAEWTLLAVAYDRLDDLGRDPPYGTNVTGVTSVSDLVLKYRYAAARSVRVDS